MPIYVYQCGSCGAVEEHIQSMSEAPVTKCQSCGGPLSRSLTSAAFHLKGGGWYKDGYASTGGPSSSGGDGGSSGKSDAGSSSGSGSSAGTSAS